MGCTIQDKTFRSQQKKGNRILICWPIYDFCFLNIEILLIYCKIIISSMGLTLWQMELYPPVNYWKCFAVIGEWLDGCLLTKSHGSHVFVTSARGKRNTYRRMNDYRFTDYIIQFYLGNDVLWSWGTLASCSWYAYKVVPPSYNLVYNPHYLYLYLLYPIVIGIINQFG